MDAFRGASTTEALVFEILPPGWEWHQPNRYPSQSRFPSKIVYSCIIDGVVYSDMDFFFFYRIINTLSKQATSTPPLKLMCLALRQKIFLSLRRRCANAVVAVKAAGSMGGTTNVTISSEWRIISFVFPWLFKNYFYSNISFFQLQV